MSETCPEIRADMIETVDLQKRVARDRARKELDDQVRKEIGDQGRRPDWGSLRRKALEATDPAAHYRHVLRVAIGDEDIARGYVEVKVDPYRVCDLYDVGGGPREHAIKKLLRWTDKGQSEDKVLAEIDSILRRWHEMREEDRRLPCST